MNDKIYIPSKGSDSWKEFLAEPDKQWKTGFSARSLANCWEDQSDFPIGFRSPLDKAGLKIEMILGIPEYKVHLDTKKAPSQNDLFVLCKDSTGLSAMMIEGKVSEPFDELISNWNNHTLSRTNRLNFLTNKLEFSYSIKDLSNYRYQLFHRTVSSILVAEKFRATKAIMIIHSFSQKDEWFADYSDFVKLIKPSISPLTNEINHCKTLSSGIELYIGWIKGDKKYLIK